MALFQAGVAKTNHTDIRFQKSLAYYVHWLQRLTVALKFAVLLASPLRRVPDAADANSRLRAGSSGTQPAHHASAGHPKAVRRTVGPSRGASEGFGPVTTCERPAAGLLE